MENIRFPYILGPRWCALPNDCRFFQMVCSLELDIRQEKLNLAHLKLKKEPPKLPLLETPKGKAICFDLFQVMFFFLSWVHHHLGTIPIFFRPWISFLNCKFERTTPKSSKALEFSAKTRWICVNFMYVTSASDCKPTKAIEDFQENPAPKIAQRFQEVAQPVTRIHQQPGWHNFLHYQIPGSQGNDH